MKLLRFINMHLRNDIVKIITLFLGWRILLVFILLVALNFLPIANKDKFLGGGWTNYQALPEIFSWANFDGEHYLSIAIFGYKSQEQAFFPFYPLTISLIEKTFLANYISSPLSTTVSGLIISNLSFLLALIFLWKLIRLDYSKEVSWWTLILLLIFPTSFYFASVYNESLFLLLAIGAFYSARKNNWWIATLLVIAASLTRVFGILLFPALLIEIYKEKQNLSKIWPIFLMPIGLLSYMLYLYLTVGDPIAFYHLQTNVGPQHQSGIILLPQIFYRYFNMIISINRNTIMFQTILLEIVTSLIFIFLLCYGYFKKIRLSYLFFGVAAFILPTVQGSFSSLPRYVLILFPCFLTFAILVSNFSRLIKVLLIILFILILSMETGLFLRGYWIA